MLSIPASRANWDWELRYGGFSFSLVLQSAESIWDAHASANAVLEMPRSSSLKESYETMVHRKVG